MMLLPGAGVDQPSVAGAPEVALRRRLILELGRVLHGLASPSPTLEDALARLADALDQPTQIFCTPTSLFVAFGEPGLPADTHLLRAAPGDVNLGRLADVDRLLEDVVAGRVTPEVALDELGRIRQAAPRHGRASELAAFGVASAGAAVFFGGGVGDVLAAGVLALLLGVLTLAARRWVSLGRVLELVGALLVSGLAVAAGQALPQVQPALVTLAALIVFVPGYTVTVALGELAARHWVSGTARLAGAGGVFLILGMGVALGHRLAPALLGDAAREPAVAQALPGWALPVALLTAPLAFLVLFQARRRDAPWILLASLAAWASAQLVPAHLGAEVAAFTGALVLGLVGNVIGRALRRPSSVTKVPGLMLLVPGSIGYRSVEAFLAKDALAGVEAAASTALTAAALVGGLLAANGLFPSRRSL